MGKGRSNQPYFRTLMDPKRKKAESGPVENPLKAAKTKAKAALTQPVQSPGAPGKKSDGKGAEQKTFSKSLGKTLGKPLGKKHGKQQAKKQTAAQTHGRPLDGEGRPYITLVQFLKTIAAVETGGAGKHVVRSGVIQVNGEAEIRPSRKLHEGDQVLAGGESHIVKL